jgi:hypothetical protein
MVGNNVGGIFLKKNLGVFNFVLMEFKDPQKKFLGIIGVFPNF